MPSKDVMDGIQMAHGLTAIVGQLTEPIAETLSPRLSPLLRKGEALPDLDLIQQLMNRLVVIRLQALMSAEEISSDALIGLDQGILELLGLGDLKTDEE